MAVTMRTADAVPILKKACKIPFGTLLAGHPADLTTNKGHAGQLIEQYIGLSLGNALTDFQDGELKTNKTRPDGQPLETIAVTQICKIIDDLLDDPPKPFEQSSLAIKLNNLLIVPVVKAGQCCDWYLLDVYHVDLAQNRVLLEQFAKDYVSICRDLRSKVASGGRVGTTNGRYLQVRSKDSKPYRPIYSNIFRREVSTKNHAFYLQTSFVRDIISGRIQ